MVFFDYSVKSETDCSKDAADLLQNSLHIFDRAEDQCGDDDVHGLVLHFLHVLPRRHNELVVGQMLVIVHTQP